MSERRRTERRRTGQDYLLSDEQVALLAGVPVNTVRKWRQTGTLPFVKVGRHPRVWFSVFQKTFQKPDAKGTWEEGGGNVKIPPAGNIRRLK
jgi:excisionase family DNA binding protein